MTLKTLSQVDVTNKRELQMYEDYMRERMGKLGYRIIKRSSSQDVQPSGDKRKGFRIVLLDTDDVVAGENYDLSLADVETFWLARYNEKNAGKAEERFRKRLKKMNAIQLDGGWIVTNDARALQALKNHIAQYGSFDADGHGAGGDIASVMYRAYRPWFCPEFSRVWPIDGDWHNLADVNLRSDADETTLLDGVIPITKQRRIWHDEFRIALKLPIRDELFFMDYSQERFCILCNEVLCGWYVQEQIRNTKTAYRLYCRMDGGAASLAEIVALHDVGKINANDAVGSILAGKRWLRNNDLQVDHLKDNAQNNCSHNLCIVKSGLNGGKSDSVTEIMLPYVFLPVRVGSMFRVLCGRAQYHADTNDYDLTTLKMIVCQGEEQFFKFVKEFKKVAETNRDMHKRPSDHNLTSCAAQMFADDGQEYHGDIYNPVEMLLRAREDEFEHWDGNCLWLNT